MSKPADNFSNLIFLDTETTGIDILVDHLFQVAYKFDGKIYSSYFKPSLPISVKSMSISHITNNMIDDKPAFSNSKMKNDLGGILKDNILVAHNALFDIDMLEKEGLRVEKYIDTLKIVRFLDIENKIPEYNLQYLRYFLEFDIEAVAHDARGDIIVLEKLFEYLYDKMFEKHENRSIVLEKMIDISKNPLLFNIFNFGKHKGKKIEEVLTFDKGYLEWMLDKKLNSEHLDEDWIYTLKYYLKVS